MPRKDTPKDAQIAGRIPPSAEDQAPPAPAPLELPARRDFMFGEKCYHRGVEVGLSMRQADVNTQVAQAADSTAAQSRKDAAQ